MSILETIHQMNPAWFLVPAGLFFFAYIMEEYTGAEFKKTEEELENERVKRRRN